MELLNGGWIKTGNLMLFPDYWQRPAKTEEWVYETLIGNKINSKFVEYIAFPWATLIDLILRNKQERAKVLINALKSLPPKRCLLRVTACQHINIGPVEKFLDEIKVSDLFWAHKLIGKQNIGNLRLHPLALFPVAFFDGQYESQANHKKRKYLASFMGAYDKNGYITKIREEIFCLPKRPDFYIEKTESWHYELEVYKEYIDGFQLTIQEKNNISERKNLYKRLMLESKFVLCPSGSGPNSIRLWESISFGCIPVLLSDSYDETILNKFIYLKLNEDMLNNVLIDKFLEPSEQCIIDRNNVATNFLFNVLDFFDNKNIRMYV